MIFFLSSLSRSVFVYLRSGLTFSSKRAECLADPLHGIVGVGDGASKFVAEKLAAYHAVLRLAKAGRFDAENKPIDAGERVGLAATVVLSSCGKTIDITTAKSFIEYYCHRFNFGSPTFKYYYEKKGWTAVLSIADRTVGSAQRASKKFAHVHSFLDAAKYLDESDSELFASYSKRIEEAGDWTEFPPVELRLSSPVEADLRELVYKSTGTELFSRAQTLDAKQKQDKAQLKLARSSFEGSEGEREESAARTDALKKKSEELLQRLEAYEKDESLAKMRKQRASLPVLGQAADIISKINANPVSVLVAATGSGMIFSPSPSLFLTSFLNFFFCWQARRRKSLRSFSTTPSREEKAPGATSSALSPVELLLSQSPSALPPNAVKLSANRSDTEYGTRAGLQRTTDPYSSRRLVPSFASFRHSIISWTGSVTSLSTRRTNGTSASTCCFLSSNPSWPIDGERASQR
jgi:hypothetical protein